MREVFSYALAVAGAIAILSLTPAPAAAQAAKSQAIPRAADGKPDLSGVWAGPGFKHTEGSKYPDVPGAGLTRFNRKDYPFRPGGEALWNRKMTGEAVTDDPTLLCLPLGFPFNALAPRAQQFFQPPGYLVIVYEDYHTTRIIHMDGRPHPKDLDLTWMGNSVGHWEGDTAVIDTIGLKEWGIDGGGNHMHSDAAHFIERYRRTGPTTMFFDLTVDDPKIFTKPWDGPHWEMYLHPEWEILEDVCEENNKDPGLIDYLHEKK